ncbi:MAG: hypothetical protein IPG54_06455 [Sphingomonadales bacterium]|jgi:hypothetical protein|nr:hypothetical protein [Sphingomonadales bacterium]MBK9002583.1 hypothetical protein [Sphingomonadales bacterium]MBK9267803.1 hypothetical protein [Sphingomonadales bacterium]MBP6433298.1 hypothetical protein [Sphingorhabdus sp.]
MIPFLLLVAAGIGWGLWSGKLMPKQLLPLALVIAGAVLALRGAWLLGLPAVGVGVFWFRGMTLRLSRLRHVPGNEFELAAARWLLGVSVNDDAEKIRARHKELVAKNDPERGDDDERKRKLNEARDLLLDDLKRKKG